MEDNDITTKLISETEKLMTKLTSNGIDTENVKLLGQIVDIHKDIKNEEYWKEKIMRYRGNYRENYRESNYGRRGVPGTGRYRGEDMLDEMHDRYNEYNETGRYGHDSKSALKQMLKSAEDFMCMLMDEASSQEEVDMIKRTARNISDM